jgi:hypothetical protein
VTTPIWNVLSADDEAARGGEQLVSYLRAKYGPPVVLDTLAGGRRSVFTLPDRKVWVLEDVAAGALLAAGVFLQVAPAAPVCPRKGLAAACTAPGTATVPYTFITGSAPAIAAASVLAAAIAAKNLWALVQMLLAPPGVCMPGCQQVVAPALPPPPTIAIVPAFLGGTVTVTVSLSATITCV